MPKEFQMKKSYLAISISGTLLIGCAGTESYQTKMERYKARSGENILVPEIKTANLQFSVQKSGRAPASVASDSSMTNKKLYFMSLYAQYESLKTVTNNSTAPSLSICPSFHTGLISYQEKHPTAVQSSGKKFSYSQAEIGNEQYTSAHPELYLPVGQEGTTPSVMDIIKGTKEKMSEVAVSELMQNAVNLHLAKTYTELRELCDYGASSNYYIYENLITHIKNSSFPASSKNMDTLLKTTLFSNRAILTSLNKETAQGRAIASEKAKIPFSDEVIARLNVPWANEYFNYLKTTK
jgi:hypothetical protein